MKICLKQIEFRKEILQYGKHAPKNYNASMLKFMQQNLFLIEKYWENKGVSLAGHSGLGRIKNIENGILLEIVRLL